jgi:four helix bundle protein
MAAPRREIPAANVVGALPKTTVGRASVGANYRAACRGRSKAEFVSRLGTVEEEADESAYWMELVIEGALLKKEQVDPLRREACELTAIMAASRISAKNRA